MGLDSHHTLLREGLDDTGAEGDGLEKTERHDRHHHVKREVARLPTERDGRIAADDMRGDLEHRFTHHRIHLSRHDGRARLGIREADLPDPASGTRRQPAQIIGDLGQANGQSL